MHEMARLALHIPRRQRILGLVLGISFAVIGITASLALIDQVERGLLDRSVAAASLVATIALTVAGVHRTQVALTRTTELLVASDGLTIRNRILFSRDVHIPSHAISVASVDEGTAHPGSSGNDRFPLRPGTEESQRSFSAVSPPEYLYSSQRALLLPHISDPNETPNLVVLFTRPLLLAHRRWALWGTALLSRYPSRAPEAGFWATLEQPEAARPALALITSVRDLTREDIAPLERVIPNLPKIRRRQIAFIVFFAGLTIVRIAVDVWPEEDTDYEQAESCAAIETFMEGARPLTSRALPPGEEQVLGEIADLDVPSSYSLAESGYGTIEDVAGGRVSDNQPEWERRLRALGFRHAYANVWTKGSDGVLLEVVEFATPAAAVDYLAWEVEWGCAERILFDVPVEGALASRHIYNGQHVARVNFVRGTRSFNMAIWDDAKIPSLTDLRNLAQQLETRAEKPRLQ